jgi:N-acetylglucosaminyl-diphospho-decaprenol L-rhamnosyltransferase
MKFPTLAAVVINYDSGYHLRNCLAELTAATGEVPADLIVVDNASTDESLSGVAQDYPVVQLVENPENVGYGTACNQGFRTTDAQFVCFLNPDVVPEPGSLSAMAAAMAANPEVGVLGPRLNNPDGSRYPSCRVIPNLSVAVGHAILGLLTENNRFTRAYQLLDGDHAIEREVDWVSGAAMMVRREAFEHVGGFDESYFMYVEDVDLCSRLRHAGWKALYFPQAQMMHHVAGSSRRTPYKMIFHHHLSLLRYAISRTRGLKRLALPLIIAGLACRLLVVWLVFFLRHGRKGAAGAPSALLGPD